MMAELKLACSDFTFPLLPHEDALDLIATLGISAVDIGLFPDRSHFQPKDYVDDMSGAAKELRAKVYDRGLVFADLFVVASSDLHEMAPNHPDANQRAGWRDLFLRTLEFASECGGQHITTSPGVCFNSEPTEQSLKRASEELAWCVEKATEAGHELAVEAHMWSVARTPALARQLVDMTRGLTLTLDYGHYTTQGFPDDEIEPLIEHASHFHARATCCGLLQTTLNNNIVDFVRVLEAMKECDYPGYVELEYVRMDDNFVPDVDNLSETILLRDLLREAWGDITG